MKKIITIYFLTTLLTNSFALNPTSTVLFDEDKYEILSVRLSNNEEELNLVENVMNNFKSIKQKLIDWMLPPFMHRINSQGFVDYIVFMPSEELYPIFELANYLMHTKTEVIVFPGSDYDNVKNLSELTMCKGYSIIERRDYILFDNLCVISYPHNLSEGFFFAELLACHLKKIGYEKEINVVLDDNDRIEKGMLNLVIVGKGHDIKQNIQYSLETLIEHNPDYMTKTGLLYNCMTSYNLNLPKSELFIYHISQEERDMTTISEILFRAVHHQRMFFKKEIFDYFIPVEIRFLYDIAQSA